MAGKCTTWWMEGREHFCKVGFTTSPFDAVITPDGPPLDPVFELSLWNPYDRNSSLEVVREFSSLGCAKKFAQGFFDVKTQEFNRLIQNQQACSDFIGYAIDEMSIALSKSS